MEKLRVALAQLKSVPDPEDNLKKEVEFMEMAHSNSAGMIVFPEYSNFYAESRVSADELYEIAERENAKFLSKLAEAARRLQMAVVVGIYERGERRPEVYSAAYYIKSNGEIGARYRKSHLYVAFGSSEAKRLAASDDRPLIFDYMGFKFGLIMCYEIRFPELARQVALLGADALIIPSAWYAGYNKMEQWEVLVKARAMENTIYVLTSNQIGNIYTGTTMACDPAGIVIARATEEEGLVYADLSKERIIKVRETLPLLKQRRKELYYCD